MGDGRVRLYAIIAYAVCVFRRFAYGCIVIHFFTLNECMEGQRQMILETHQCDSSAITSIAWAGKDKRTGVLSVTFTSGAVYRYARVPYATFAAFKAADSAGKFFATRVRNAYEHEAVEA